ncbi:MAG: cytochrome c oxidase subunit II [Planctomycetota bacterium]|jgi:cytochrome c oxidase subunit 2|nr:cytochrome c oxidase subunit II [Planctomycetota bacterium]
MTLPPATFNALLATSDGATFWLPEAASTIAGETDFMFDLINWICYFFFALVTFLLVWFAWRYRQKSHSHEGFSAGPTHHTPLEVTWTIVPLIIVIVIFFMGFKGFLNFATPPRDTYDIDVVAAKWLWTFKYPNGASSDDLYIPSERPVRLVMRSEDVLHSLFIPQFRIKRDVVPGRYNQVWFQSDDPTGEDEQAAYDLFCTEYCGTGHSNMNRKVYVLEETAFEEWVTEQGQWLDAIPDEELYFKAGPKLFARCANCHSLDGGPNTGPTWKGLWDRSREGSTVFDDGTTLADHVGPGKEFATPEDYLRNSILNPGNHLVKPYTNAMPTFKGQLNDRMIDAIIGMIKNVDEFNADGSWKNAPAE